MVVGNVPPFCEGRNIEKCKFLNGSPQDGCRVTRWLTRRPNETKFSPLIVYDAGAHPRSRWAIIMGAISGARLTHRTGLLDLPHLLYKAIRSFGLLVFGRRLLRTFVFYALTGMCGANAASNTDYQLTPWKARDGAPSDIWTVTQDQAGFLWLGTGDGLYRFDGVHFWRFHSLFDENLPHGDITSLLAAPGGALWLGYFEGGITCIENGHVENFGQSEGFPSGTVFSIVQDEDGIIWAATSNGLARFAGGNWAVAGKDWDYPTNDASWALLDSRGTLWVATGQSLVYLVRGAHTFKQSDVAPVGHFSPVTLALDPRGVLWASDEILGTRALQSSAVQKKVAPEAMASPQELHAYAEQAKETDQTQALISADRLHFDSHGRLWGTDRRAGGVFLIEHPERFDDGHALKWSDVDIRFNTKNGLTSNKAVPVFEDREGNVWVGTNAGLNGLHRGDVTPLEGPTEFDMGKPFGMAPEDPGNVWLAENGKLYKVTNGTPAYVQDMPLREYAFFADRKGALWTQSWEGKFYRKVGALVTTILPPTPLSDYKISALTPDQKGGLWLGFNDGRIYHRAELGTWTTFDTPSAASPIVASAMSVDNVGRLWIGYSDGHVRLRQGPTDHEYPLANGPHIGAITAMVTSSSIDLIGGESGLARLANAGLQTLTKLGDRSITGVSGIVLRKGDYWINTNQGLIRISARELQKAFESASFQPQYRLFDYRDGLPGVAFQGKVGSTLGLDTTGNVWIQTNQGIAYIDPDRLHVNKVAPSTSVLSVTVDGKRFEATSGLALPQRTTSLSISYTAPSLYIPERVRFKYKLLGVDEDWQEAGQRREAFYTNLRPGSYTFRVIAANDDGVWGKQGTTLQFSITPTFYQTVWFLTLCIALSLLVAVSLISIRLRQLAERARMREEVRSLERERIARELHDTLLQTIQGLIMRFHAIVLRMPGDDPSRQPIESALDAAAGAVDEGRERVKQLRGPSERLMGLEDSFYKLVEGLPCPRPVSFRLTTVGEVRALDPFAHDEIYRIGGEAIVNAYKHAGASLIELRLDYALRFFQLTLHDDGIGIESDTLTSEGSPGHWGLLSMKERATRIRGRLAISSSHSTGTEVRLSVPASSAYLRNGLGWRAVLSRIMKRRAIFDV